MWQWTKALLLMLALGLASWSTLQAQAPEAGAASSTNIPGTAVEVETVYLPGGTFEWQRGEVTQTAKVAPFWIGTYEVTHDQFSLFQNREEDTNASTWEGGTYAADAVSRPTPPYIDVTSGMGHEPRHPAVNMTQQAAILFCGWLYQKTGEFYRLPTEAEWAYACQRSTQSMEDLDAHAWYYDNSEESYHKAGEKAPTGLGIYDLLGNVAEWTLDAYTEPEAAGEKVLDNPWAVPERRYGRVVKGGSFDSDPEDCTCAAREKSSIRWQQRDPQIPKSLWWNTDSPFVGFRLVKPAQQPSPEEVEAFFAKAIKW
mgnify:CR=1 FL=1